MGWGVLGKEVVLALSRITDVWILSPPGLEQQIKDEIDLFQFRKLLLASEEHQRMIGSSWGRDAPVIQAAMGGSLAAYVPEVGLPCAVGFAVFEENVLSKASIERARTQFRHLVTGSTYCADVLREHGLANVSVVYHGVDSRLFRPQEDSRPFFKDHFVVFSGGKFEHRKGQDIVIRAYKVLQDRHRDVMLVNSWYNSWRYSRETMAASTLIEYRPPGNGNYIAWMNELLARNGLDLERVITVGLRDNQMLPTLYHATDLGIFPNRVEGGTNLVLMEYMACGKPVVASYNSGHKDVIRRENAVLIEKHGVLEKSTTSGVTCTWNETDLEETIEKLEWCYQHRDDLHALGRQAAADMRQFTWDRVGRRILEAVDEAEKRKSSLAPANVTS